MSEKLKPQSMNISIYIVAKLDSYHGSWNKQQMLAVEDCIE